MSTLFFAGLIVFTAFAAVFVGIIILKMTGHVVAEGPFHPQSGTMEIGLEPVFIFDGEDLIDASPAAHQILASANLDRNGTLSQLVWTIGWRFPDLKDSLKSLKAKGSFVLRSSDASETATLLHADYRGGLTRISLLEETRDNRRLMVDPLSWRLAAEETETLREIANRSTALIWREDPNGNVTWANSAYLDLAQRMVAQGEELSWPCPKLFAPAVSFHTDTEQRVSLLFEDKPTWFEITVSPDDRDARLCFAHPIDKLVSAEHSLREFIQTLTKTFAQLPIGLAVFDKDRKLQLFNPALVDLTGLPLDFLSARPKMLAFLDQLRQRNRLPEPKDYKAWRRQLVDLERGAKTGQYQDNWLLPDGLVFRATARPHPGGGIALMVEDISDQVQKTSSFRNELDLGRAILNTIGPIFVVFSSSGRVISSNTAFSELWGLEAPERLYGTDIEGVIQGISALCVPDPFWRELAQYVATIGERDSWERVIRMKNGRAFTCEVRPIQGTHSLLTIQLETVSTEAVLPTTPKRRRVLAS